MYSLPISAVSAVFFMIPQILQIVNEFGIISQKL